jgi:hypothetical protein
VNAAEITAGIEASEPGLGLVDQLLRRRAAVLARIAAGDDLRGLIRTMLLTIVIGMALVGAALGAYRGGAQIAFAAIKLPLVMLLTAALCAPTLTALQLALGRPASLLRDLALVVTALAFGTLVLCAQAPLFLLLATLRLPYHEAILLTVACFAVGGLASVSVLARGIGPRSFVVLGVLLAVFAVVGSQMSWTLRPYLVRPRSESVPFLRDLEGSLWESLGQSLRSAQGIYDTESER